VRCDHLDAFLPELGVERIGVINRLGLFGAKQALIVSSTRVASCGGALAACTEIETPEPSTTAMSFVPLPRLVFSTDGPLFGHHEGTVDETLREVQASMLLQVLSQDFKDA